ncbi:MAG: hypothetical protein IH914_11230 [candidate division Zixibacteria bacterium]|nr:hypothetical protein [candidate division Zixibacteria bacterium]
MKDRKLVVILIIIGFVILLNLIFLFVVLYYQPSTDFLEERTFSEGYIIDGIEDETFFEIEDDSLRATFEGNGNSLHKKSCGIQFKISFDEDYLAEYVSLLQQEDEISSLPIEYYNFSWSSFARDDRLTPKTIPIKSALIDSSNIRNQSGSDVYISRIIRDLLSNELKVKYSATMEMRMRRLVMLADRYSRRSTGCIDNRSYLQF